MTTRVLLVEDQRVDQQVARRVLEGAGADVTLATTKAEALRRLSDASYDYVIADTVLPDSGGSDRYQLVMALRAKALGARMVALLVPGDDDDVARRLRRESITVCDKNGGLEELAQKMKRRSEMIFRESDAAGMVEDIVSKAVGSQVPSAVRDGVREEFREVAKKVGLEKNGEPDYDAVARFVEWVRKWQGRFGDLAWHAAKVIVALVLVSLVGALWVGIQMSMVPK